MKATKGILLFCIRKRHNNLKNEVQDKTSGIGLQNVKRRLDLLYTGRYELLINKDTDWFNVSLSLKII